MVGSKKELPTPYPTLPNKHIDRQNQPSRGAVWMNTLPKMDLLHVYFLLLVFSISVLFWIPFKKLTHPHLFGRFYGSKVLSEAQTEHLMFSSPNHRRVFKFDFQMHSELNRARLICHWSIKQCIPWHTCSAHVPSCLITSLALRQGICHTHDRNLIYFSWYKELGHHATFDI